MVGEKKTRRSTHQRRQKKDHSGSDSDEETISDRAKIQRDANNFAQKSALPKGNRNSIIPVGEHKTAFTTSAAEKQIQIFNIKLWARGDKKMFNSEILEGIYNSPDFLNINIDLLVSVMIKLYRPERQSLLSLLSARTDLGDNIKTIITRMSKFVHELVTETVSKKAAKKMDEDEKKIRDRIVNVERSAEILNYLRLVISIIWYTQGRSSDFERLDNLIFEEITQGNYSDEENYYFESIDDDMNSEKTSDEERDYEERAISGDEDSEPSGE